MSDHTCGECAEWKTEYATLYYSLDPPRLSGACDEGKGIRFDTEDACEHFKERKAE